MKQVIGIEHFNIQEDFEEGLVKMKAIMKDGDECDMVYISENDEDCYIVIAKGKFVPNKNYTKFEPSIVFDKKMIKVLGIDIDALTQKIRENIKMLPK